MKIPCQNRRSEIEFSLTSMIDIVFLLIIFFLVASHFVTGANEETIQLPQSSLSQVDHDEKNTVVITVTEHGYSMNKEPLSLDQLVARMELTESQNDSDEPIEWKVRTDAKAQYRLIEPVLIACARLPNAKMKLAVEGRK
ncbi:ExbD/TolR family protein [Lacunimicrobium album]